MQPPPRLDNQLCFAVYTASQAIVRAYQPFLDRLGVTYTQFLVLMALWESDDLTLGQLGTRLQLDSGTLTPLSRRMEAAGLVVRVRDPDDERRRRVQLTEKGRELGAVAGKEHAELVCRLTLPGAVSAPDLRDSLRMLAEMLRSS